MHNASNRARCLLHSRRDYSGIMNDAADRLKRAREKSGYSSAKAAAEAMGVSVPTYIQHENGTRGYPASKAERYARFFRVAPEWLLYGKSVDTQPVELGPRLFVKGSVAAGVWKEAWEIPEDEWEMFTGRADVAAPVQRRFGLRVVGESMNEIYPPGTILECIRYEHGEPIPSGKRVIVIRRKIDGSVEATVKELVRDETGAEWLVPRSRNPAYQAFRGDQPDSPDIASIEIVGVVVASTRPE
jgi:phage repressor protein C with HTH and peptisase S24 domain